MTGRSSGGESVTIAAGTTLALDVSATATDTLKADTSTLPADNDATFAVDSGPAISAPGTVSGDPGTAISFSVTASDADGEPIDSLVADFSSLPPGHTAVFTANEGNTAGTFSWTPRPPTQASMASRNRFDKLFARCDRAHRRARLVGYWTLERQRHRRRQREHAGGRSGAVNYANGKSGRAVALSASAAGRLQGTATHAYDLLSSGFTVEFW